jgi:AcrR family transcriptional regulator
MAAEKNPRGRPVKGQADSRIKLILAARRCFATQAYTDVTTRMLAAEAGVNASLIRYYFLNKDGLYQQMLGDVADEFQKAVAEFVQTHPNSPFEAIFRAHMSLSQHSPDIPKLLFRELAFNDGQNRQLVIDNVAKPNQRFIETLFKPLVDKNLLKDGFDPLILMLCSLSISIMPHLLGDLFEQLVGVKLDAAMAEKIIWQNSQMVQFGCMQQPQAHIHD